MISYLVSTLVGEDLFECLDSVDYGMVEWNGGIVKWWNSGLWQEK